MIAPEDTQIFDKRIIQSVVQESILKLKLLKSLRLIRKHLLAQFDYFSIDGGKAQDFSKISLKRYYRIYLVWNNFRLYTNANGGSQKYDRVQRI